MKHVKTGRARKQFAPLLESARVQAAVMVLKPGGASDERPSNEHPRAEQWLFVVSGSGVAIVEKQGAKRHVRLAENSLLLIEQGERHRIKNTGQRELRTINFYAPPAYDREGNVRPKAKR